MAGRVERDGSPQRESLGGVDYSIASSDGKTAGWGTNDGGPSCNPCPYYYIGRWDPDTEVTITLNNPDLGHSCRWSFTIVDRGTVGGDGCSATITIGDSTASSDWDNHLWFYLSPQGVIGYLDGANCNNFSGWAGDRDVPNQALEVRFYADGDINSGTLIGSTTANGEREAVVCSALGGTNCSVCPAAQPQCQHGFEFSTPQSLKDGNNHQIYAYGINAPGTSGDNTLLSGAPQTINCQPLANAWFKTQGGDVHGNSEVGTTIPPTAPAGTYFSSMPAGVVSTGRIAGFLGNIASNMSIPGWQVAEGGEDLRGFGTSRFVYDYEFFYKKFGSPSFDNFDGNITQILPNIEIYYSGDTVSYLDGDWTNFDKKAIIFIDGDLLIDTKITLAQGAFLAFIVSGNISIDPSLGNDPTGANRDDPNIEGVFITDGDFDTQLGAAGHERFVGRGIFASDSDLNRIGGFSFQRDLGIENSNFSAEYFEYKSDLLVNFPQRLGVRRMTWQEVAP